MRLDVQGSLRITRDIVYGRSINIVSNSSGRFGRGVDVVVGGVGRANVKDRALGMARGVNMNVTDMCTSLDSFGMETPVLGS